MTVLSVVQARRRYVLLRGLRWLPTGFLLPVLIILMRDRGLSLTEIGLVTAMQGVVILVLELPTGGLADALGRRPVLLLAGVLDVASHVVLILATDVWLFAVSWALQGVYRSLESGPLEAWYVDASLDADQAADIERGLANGGVVTGLAIAIGALTSGALVGLDPIPGVEALVVPLLVSIALRLVEMAIIAWLVVEVRPARGLVAAQAAVRRVPGVIRGALRLVRAPALGALVAVELLWGTGMTTFETLMPPRLVAVLGGDAQAGVAVLGVTGAVAWAASAGGAAIVPALVRLLGGSATWAGAALRVAQGLGVVGMALAAGPLGLVAAYVVVYAIHGASNPVHSGLIHRAATAEHRTTVVSANSLAAHIGGATGGIALGALADATSIPAAMATGAVILAAAAPLYLVSARHTAAAALTTDVEFRRRLTRSGRAARRG